MEWTKGRYIVSDDYERIDVETVCAWLADSYWAKDRPKHSIVESIQNTISFGMYVDADMLGFARVTTDKAVFGWISDVVIDPTLRGTGLGTWLMECILAHPIVARLPRIGLATRDAHEFYEKFGFERRETMVRRID